MALSITIGAKKGSVLQSGRNGARCYSRGEMALITIGAKWRSVLQSGRNGAQYYNRGEMAWGDLTRDDLGKGKPGLEQTCTSFKKIADFWFGIS